MVAQTSIDAYHEIIADGTRWKKRELVHKFIEICGPHTRTQISEKTGLKINVVCGRVRELVQDGVFEENRTVLDRETNKHVKVVELAKGQQELEL